MNEHNSGATWRQAADGDAIHEQAADWFVRLREPNIAPEQIQAWQSWMSSDERHPPAFDRIAEVSNVLRSIPTPPLPYVRPMWSRLWLGGLAAAVLGIVAALTWMRLSSQSPAWVAGGDNVLQTVVGENRVVTLTDGSKVTLGGATTLRVELGEQVRQLDLLRGEAFFVVAHDASRPFKVRAGDTTVVAIGTEFNVKNGSDRVVVSVVEGRVNVEPTMGSVSLTLLHELRPKSGLVRVSAGEQTVARGAGIEPAVQLSDAVATTSWQTGRLAFRLQPLRYVLEDVNRYAPKPLVVEDERVAGLLFSGTVMGNNVMGWVASIESAFDLRAVEEAGRIVLVPR